MKTIAYQGVQGAFSYITAVKEFGESHSYLPMQSFKDVFEMVGECRADCAVIPIENSLIGSIYENYDLLNLFEMQIVGERYTKIEHCLLTLPASGVSKHEMLKGIKKVLSHPKALEQCKTFFQKHPWIEPVVYVDTAAAAAEVAVCGDPAYAAIASANAGELYGLDILENGIEDDPKNYTRFVTISKRGVPDYEADKCTLLITLNHVPGTLAELLKLIAGEGINLTKLESRPMRGSLFEYVFYIDLEFKISDRHIVDELLNVMCNKVKKLKLLGFYKRGIPWTC